MALRIAPEHAHRGCLDCVSSPGQAGTPSRSDSHLGRRGWCRAATGPRMGPEGEHRCRRSPRQPSGHSCSYRHQEIALSDFSSAAEWIHRRWTIRRTDARMSASAAFWLRDMPADSCPLTLSIDCRNSLQPSVRPFRQPIPRSSSRAARRRSRARRTVAALSAGAGVRGRPRSVHAGPVRPRVTRHVVCLRQRSPKHSLARSSRGSQEMKRALPPHSRI